MTARKGKDKEAADWSKSAWGFFNATTIWLLACVTTPAACVSCTRQAASTSLRQRECNGIWHCKIRRFLPFHRCYRGCVVAMKNPPAPVLQSGASLSFPFLAVMSCAGFLWDIFGESHVKHNPLTVATLFHILPPAYKMNCPLLKIVPSNA